MQENKVIHIAYIGRLEKEKGIEIVIDCVKRSHLENRKIIWHICGTGSHSEQLQGLKHDSVRVYGQVTHDGLAQIFGKIDLVLMPSLFLETFGLVALESLSHGVPVCGFDSGGLQDFIHPKLILDADTPVDSFFRIIDSDDFPLVDISRFSNQVWLGHLRQLTEGYERILLVNDYEQRVGGAEQYIYILQNALRGLGKQVQIYGYKGELHRYSRILLMLLAPFSFWRGFAMSTKLSEYSPDLIWMHSIVRYIGPHGLRAIATYDCKKYITHHDLGLIVPKPSQLYSKQDIPMSINLADWMPKKINSLTIVGVLWKWYIIRWLWTYLGDTRIVHILPSDWMKQYYTPYMKTPPIIFPHTTQTPSPVKE